MKSGESFELEIFEAVKRYLETEMLGLLPKACRVFHHKPYYSLDRRSHIIVDVSIEIQMTDASEAHLVWVWECKDYRRLVDVSDVEEFHAKLQQIGADRTKGTMISRFGFQKAAIEFARSKGIGLGRYSEEIAWVFRLKGIPREFIANLEKPEIIESILYGDDFYTRQTGIKCFGFSTRQLPLWAAFLGSYVELHISQELIDLGLLALDGRRLIRGPNAQ